GWDQNAGCARLRAATSAETNLPPEPARAPASASNDRAGADSAITALRALADHLCVSGQHRNRGPRLPPSSRLLHGPSYVPYIRSGSAKGLRGRDSSRQE